MPIPSIPRPSGCQQDGGAASPEGAGRVSGVPMQLLDSSVLQDMERDFVDTGVVGRFARDFSLSLGDKIDRLARGLEDDDAFGARDAVTSLSTSADMIGAERLGDAVRVMRDHLMNADGTVSVGMIAGLRSCADETLRELERTFPRRT